MDAANERQRRAMIVGLGKTGLSAARYLHAQGYVVAVTDSRDKPPALDALREALPDVAVFVGGFSEAALANADVVVVSPGVPLHDPFVARIRDAGVEMIGDIELFSRVVSRPVIAITGSNGKSTVATLFARMAEAAHRRPGLGGNLGTPALDLLADRDADLFVLELSSFQLESTHSLAPAAAVVLNVTPDHIDWHGSMESYARAKSRIFRNAAVCVFNRDDAWSARLAAGLPNAVSFGLDRPEREIDVGLLRRDGADWLARGSEALLPVSALKLTGAHNHANALACLALGYAIGLSTEKMLAALRDFAGLPHRMEWVAEIDGVVYVNDSKGTNVGASMAAIVGAERPLVLIAGGDGKGQDFDAFAAAMPGRVHHLVLLGKDAPAIEAAVAGRVPTTCVHDMREAVTLAARVARVGDMVLLSPACSSLDMYANYEERGRQFAEGARELAA